MIRFTPPVGLKKMKYDGASIQRMEFQDLGEILSIEVASSLTPWSLDMFIEEMKNPIAYCFVLKHGKGAESLVIGFICFRNVREESELLNIAVHPQYRRLGYGKKLMQFYLQFCYPLGIKTFYLEVNPSNQAALRLYQNLSYESFGRREKFYQGKFDALLLRKKV